MDDLPVRQAEEHDLAFGEPGEIRGRLDAGRFEIGKGVRLAVGCDDLGAGLGEVLGDRLAHLAEPGEADLHSTISLAPGPQTRLPQPPCSLTMLSRVAEI